MSIVSQTSGPQGEDFPRGFDVHSASMHLNSTVETFHLYGFMDLLEENSVSSIEHISFFMNQYCRGLFGQNTHEEIGLKVCDFVPNLISEKGFLLMAILGCGSFVYQAVEFVYKKRP